MLVPLSDVDHGDIVRASGVASGSCGAAGNPMLVFNCAGRRGILGPDAPHELKIMQAWSKAAAIAGGYTWGEVGPTVQGRSHSVVCASFSPA